MNARVHIIFLILSCAHPTVIGFCEQQKDDSNGDVDFIAAYVDDVPVRKSDVDREIKRIAKQRDSEGANGRTPVPALSKGGRMGTKDGAERRFHLNRTACLGTMAG